MVYLLALLSILIFLLWAERGRLIRKSTLDSLKIGGLKDLLNFRLPHMYIYGRWTRQYVKFLRDVLIPRLGPNGKKKFADTYHAKVLTTQHAKNIIAINHEVPLKDIEQVIPYPMARKIILSYPLDVVVLECACRAISRHPCSPSQVCMVVGKPVTDFIMEHHPEAKRLTQQEALDLLDEAHRKGCVHTAWFKDAVFERFYAICNCCKCCCVGLKIMLEHNVPLVLSSGFVAKKDNLICDHCGVCVKVCPFKAVNESCDTSYEKCMGCGVCISKCKKNARSLERDEAKGIPLEVKSL